MAEEFTFQQRFAQAAAGDFNEAFCMPGTGLMDRARNKRFTRAAFTGDQHCGRGIGNAVHDVEHVADGRMRSQNVAEGSSGRRYRWCLCSEILREPAFSTGKKSFFNCCNQITVTKWSGHPCICLEWNIRESTIDHGLFDEQGVHHNDAGSWRFCAQVGEDLFSTATGQLTIDHAGVAPASVEKLQAFGGIAGSTGMPTEAAEPLCGAGGLAAIVVDNDHSAAWRMEVRGAGGQSHDGIPVTRKYLHSFLTSQKGDVKVDAAEYVPQKYPDESYNRYSRQHMQLPDCSASF